MFFGCFGCFGGQSPKEPEAQLPSDGLATLLATYSGSADCGGGLACCGPITSLAFLPGGQLVALGSSGGAILLFSWLTSEVAAVLRGHTGAVTGMAFLPFNRLLASAGSTDGTIRLWDPHALGGAPDVLSRRLRAGDRPRDCIKRLAATRVLAPPAEHAAAVGHLAMHPDGLTFSAACLAPGTGRVDVHTYSTCPPDLAAPPPVPQAPPAPGAAGSALWALRQSVGEGEQGAEQQGFDRPSRGSPARGLLPAALPPAASERFGSVSLPERRGSSASVANFATAAHAELALVQPGVGRVEVEVGAGRGGAQRGAAGHGTEAAVVAAVRLAVVAVSPCGKLSAAPDGSDVLLYRPDADAPLCLTGHTGPVTCLSFCAMAPHQLPPACQPHPHLARGQGGVHASISSRLMLRSSSSRLSTSAVAMALNTQGGAGRGAGGGPGAGAGSQAGVPGCGHAGSGGGGGGGGGGGSVHSGASWRARQPPGKGPSMDSGSVHGGASGSASSVCGGAAAAGPASCGAGGVPMLCVLVSGSADGTCRVWDVERGVEVGRLGGHGGGVTCVAAREGKAPAQQRLVRVSSTDSGAWSSGGAVQVVSSGGAAAAAGGGGGGSAGAVSSSGVLPGVDCQLPRRPSILGTRRTSSSHGLLGGSGITTSRSINVNVAGDFAPAERTSNTRRGSLDRRPSKLSVSVSGRARPVGPGQLPLAVTGCADGRVRLWDLTSMACMGVLLGGGGRGGGGRGGAPVECVAFDDTGLMLGASTRAGGAYVWAMEV